MSTDTERSDFVERANRAYAERWKVTLEAERPGELIAVEPDSGDYVLGTSLHELDVARERKFGTKPVHIFRVGGGGAVKIGGTVPHAGVSG